MDFRILGPLEVAEGGRTIPIVGERQRALLAILLIHANEPVSTDELIDELWAEPPRASPKKNLQVQVSRLRKALGDASTRLLTQPNGYLLQVGPGELSRRAGDPAGIADALLCLSPFVQGEPERLRALTEEALAYARQAGDERLVARALAAHAVSSPAADVDAEIAEIAEVAALYRKVGDFHGLAGLYSHAGYAAITQGNYQRAAVYMDEALVLAEQSGEQVRVMMAFGNLGLASLFTGNFDDAAAHFAQQLRLGHEHAVPWMAAEAMTGLAAIAARQGDSERAARLLGAAESLANILGDAVGARLEQEFFAPARDGIGEARWAVVHTAGGGLGFEEAVGLALEPA